MTPHYDLKQQEEQQWCLGAGLVGGGSQTFLSFVIYRGGMYVFPTGLGGGVVKIFAYHMKM